MTANTPQAPASGKHKPHAKLHRACAILATALWIAALFAPYSLSYWKPGRPFALAAGGSGWFLLAIGWLGPVEYCFAWYGNLFFVIACVQAIRGKVPGFCLMTTGFMLAATSLMPFVDLDMMVDRRSLEYHDGPAVWLWLSAFITLWIPAGFGVLRGTPPGEKVNDKFFSLALVFLIFAFTLPLVVVRLIMGRGL